MRRKCNRKRGFTLVEVIVVLVILAILAAIMIPAMTGWIDKAKERRLIIACRTCVTAAQTLAVEEYAETGAVTSVDESAVKTLAGVSGDVSAIAFDKADVTQLTYTEDSESMTYTRDPSPKYTYGLGSGGQSAYTTVPEKTVTDIVKKIADNAKWKGLSGIDSSATANTDSNAYALKTALEADGIDFDEMNVAAWKYARGNEKAEEAANKGPFFYWTDTDISTVADGEKIAVMRYNTASQSYTVWEAAVSTVNGNKTFKESNKLSSKDDAKEQTYDLMLEDYANATKDGKYPK